MAKFFRLLFLIVILLIFVVSPLNIIYADSLFRAPVVGEFKITNGPGEGSTHKGVSEHAIDISTAGEKVDIYAVGDGVVEVAGTMVKNKEDKVITVQYGSNLKDLEIVGFGNYIIIRHDNGYKSLYAHLSEINVKKDEAVSKGKKIAKSGNTGLSIGQTGMHLHFEIRKEDKSVDLIGLLENFSRENFNEVYLNWRDGKTDAYGKPCPPPGANQPSGDITGSPVETFTPSQNIAQESKEKNVTFLDNIANFFKKIGEFFASVFSYKSPSYVRAAEKEEKIIEDSYQLIDLDAIEALDESEEEKTYKTTAKGKIAFESGRDGNSEIYIMNVDGSEQTNLTDNPEDDWNPCFSPDGSKIAFVSHLYGNEEIYIMNVDGSEQVNLTNNTADDWNPCFSPDGSKIAFESNRDGNAEIYVMNIDGSGQVNLTNSPEDDWNPCFSPDGSKIAFVSNRDGNAEIYIMNVDGSEQTRLTNTPVFDYDPCFSPDGSKIAFGSSDGNSGIYIMNIDGSGQVNLTNNPVGGGGPYFSPDGSKIAFQSGRDGNWEIYLMNVDGSEQTNLTDNPEDDWNPCFSPDGSKIAFVSHRDGNWEIYIMNVDGSGQVNLTNNTADDYVPSFSP